MIEVLHEILARADLRGASIYLAHEVARWPQGALTRLVTTGLLRELGPSPTVRCFNCPEQCDVEPEWRQYPTRDLPLLVFNCAHEEYGGRLEFEPEAARRWELHFQRLGALVAEALAAKGRVIEDIPGRVASLGTARLGGAAFEVFLACGLTWSDAEGVWAEATRLQASARPVVIYPSQPPERSLLDPSRGTLIRLRDFVTAFDSSLHLDVSALAERMTATRAEERSDVPEPFVALTDTEHTVLTAIGESRSETMLLVEVIAAAGYSKRSTMKAVARLIEFGFVGRPPATRRKGYALTPQGREFLEQLVRARATPRTREVVGYG